MEVFVKNMAKNDKIDAQDRYFSVVCL